MNTKEDVVFRSIQRAEIITVRECMELLSITIRKLDTQTEAYLYFQFEDLINKTFGININYSDTGEIKEDGKTIISNYQICRKTYLENLKIVHEFSPVTISDELNKKV